MANASGASAPHVEDGPWIEIIEKMELLYADLARMQTDAEERNDELSRAKAFADNVIRSLVNSLVVTDADAVISMANDACARLLGYAKEELRGKPLALVFAEGAAYPLRRDSEFWNRCRARGSAAGLETVLKTKGGALVPVSLNASVMRDRAGDVSGIVLVATDLREVKSLQARLIQSEKMSSLGRMAASVAHEINNPLGAIVVFSCLLLEKAPQDSPGRRKLETIVREAGRCRDIVRSLLDFARPGEGERARADLNAIVLRTFELLQSQSVLKNIEVALDLSAIPVEIACNANQIQQAFTNLMVNAAEAIGDRGRITIASRRDAPRHMAEVSFADTGCGIPPENVERIFEPFFSTKQEGHGTGLGLAIVYGIVERHGGTIKVESRPGEGTTFTVRLPERGSGEAAV